MADKKNSSDGAAANSPRRQGGMTKMEAVRKALDTLGKGAKPLQIQGFVKREFNIEMNTDHISTAKGEILRKAKKAKAASKRAAKVAAVAAGEEPAQLPRPAGKASRGTLSVEDVHAVADLVQRIGAKNLRSLIDVFGK
jgi:hypothetical protein